MSLIIKENFNNFEVTYNNNLNNSEFSQQEVGKAWFEKADLVRQNWKSLLQDLETFERNQVPGALLNEKDNLFVRLGEKDESITKKIRILKKIEFGVPIVFVSIIGINLLKGVGQKTIPETFGVAESDFPKGDPIINLSWQGKVFFVGAALLGTVALLKVIPIVEKTYRDLYLHDQIRNDMEFADFAKEFKHANKAEVYKITELFSQFKDLNKEAESLNLISDFS
ncbi:MAG: hypothetical protein H0X29_02880 [Parachlamydiaceae bacterium]|nr:hypothetical protein [Parachlamydiaceae bacterium]